MELSVWKQTLEGLSNDLMAAVPAVLAAAGLLIAGWLLATLFRFLAKKLVAAVVARVNTGSKLAHGLRGSRIEQDAPPIIGGFVYWVVFLFFAASAMEKLPLPVATELLQSLAYYLPKVLLAVVVLFIGLGAGSLANEWLTNALTAVGVEYGAAIGRVAQVGMLVAALIVGAQQAGVDSGFFTAILTVVIGAILGGMALAFGLGSGPIVSNIMASHYAAKAYRVGDVVRIADIEGTIREINSSSIILDGPEGEVHLPARTYAEQVSVIRGRQS